MSYTRRRFLSATAACLASAGLTAIPDGNAFAQETEKSRKGKQKDIIYRELGKTGIKLPIVGMGVMNANNPEVVKASYELGVRFFDTAAYYQYGRNEQMVGGVINRLGVRDKVVIATKALAPAQRRGLDHEQEKEKFIKIVEGSLKRLGMDFVDILHLHDVSSADEVKNPAVLEAITSLKKQKKVHFAGVSTHSNMAEVISEVTSQGFYDIVLTAVNFTMADDTALLEAIKKAAAKGIGIIAMKTQAGGNSNEARNKYKSSTIATAALKWALRNENIAMAIPGYTNFEHMNEDFSVAYDLEYTAEEKKFLKDNNIKLSMGFCRQCGTCLASCPGGADIPSLMRTHMYAVGYTNFHQARLTYDDILSDKNIQACRSCSECTARCVNQVDIPKKIEELKLIYA
jgi:predicted aldo/keto reductase-like oxidoreductase